MPPAAAPPARPAASGAPRRAAPAARPPRRRWIALAGLLLVALLGGQGGLPAASAGAPAELRWLGRSDGHAEDRWTADAAVRPWAGSGGEPAAYRDGAPVRFDDEATGRRVLIADLGGVRPGSVRFSHRQGRYLLDSVGADGIAGPTGLVKDADGELELRGANVYQGATDLRAGLLSLGHDRALGDSTLLLRGGAVAAAGSPRTIANPVRFLPAASAGPVTATVAGSQDLSLTGDVELNPGQPTLLEVTSTATTRLLGRLHDAPDDPGAPAQPPGPQGEQAPGGTVAQRQPMRQRDVMGALVKLGPGRLDLGGEASYGGGTVVAGGTLRAVAARGSATGSGPVAVLPGATLAGDGASLAGAVTVHAGGTLAPGLLPGRRATLELGDRLDMHAGSVYLVDVGLSARRRHDRVRVPGGVLLDGAMLRLRLVGRRPAAGQALTILDNLGDRPVRGSFHGLREGATVTGRDRDGRPAPFRVTYRGGDGNDVALRSLREPASHRRPPVLDEVADQTVAEGRTLRLRLDADPGEPARPLRWRLVGGRRAGATMGRDGWLRWTPREADGPGRLDLVVRVEDAADPRRFDQQRFTVTVAEVNWPPRLPGRRLSLSVAEGRRLRRSFAAADPDRPANRLAYGAAGEVPKGVRIDPASGELTWTPTTMQGPAVYGFAVWVVDGGDPSLADVQDVTVTVTQPRAARPAPAAATPPHVGCAHGSHLL
jgi:autotransporter-associated beta strand protein